MQKTWMFYNAQVEEENASYPGHFCGCAVHNLAPVFADETDTPESDDEETLLVEVDEDTTALTEINVTMQSLGWCADDDYTPPENVLFHKQM